MNQTIGDLQNEEPVHEDPRLRYSEQEYTQLKDIQSVARQRITPRAGKGHYGSGYKPEDKLQFTIQSSSAFLDRHQSFLKFKVSLKDTTKEGSDPNKTYKFIPSDGAYVFLENMKVETGDRPIDEVRGGSRLYATQLTGAGSQNYYNSEMTAQAKCWKHVQPAALQTTMKNLWINTAKSANQDWVECIVYLDNMAFFRQSSFYPLFAKTVFEWTLPQANKVMEKVGGATAGTDVASYHLFDVELNVSKVYCSAPFLKSIHDKMYESEEGLTMIMPKCQKYYNRDIPSGANEVNITLQASHSDIHGLMMMVVPKGDTLITDNVFECALPNLMEYSVKIQGETIGMEPIEGLAEAYLNYRNYYEEAGDSHGRSMLDFETFKNKHTLMCLNTTLLQHIPETVLGNGISTTDAGSELTINIRLTDGNTFPANHQLLIFVTHTSVLNFKQALMSVGV